MQNLEDRHFAKYQIFSKILHEFEEHILMVTRNYSFKKHSSERAL